MHQEDECLDLRRTFVSALLLTWPIPLFQCWEYHNSRLAYCALDVPRGDIPYGHCISAEVSSFAQCKIVVAWVALVFFFLYLNSLFLGKMQRYLVAWACSAFFRSSSDFFKINLFLFWYRFSSREKLKRVVQVMV